MRIRKRQPQSRVIGRVTHRCLQVHDLPSVAFGGKVDVAILRRLTEALRLGQPPSLSGKCDGQHQQASRGQHRAETEQANTVFFRSIIWRSPGAESREMGGKHSRQEGDSRDMQAEIEKAVDGDRGETSQGT